MTLLLDQNLSRKLLPRLSREFPGSTHVLECGLETGTDAEVWELALRLGHTIVTKDSDFLGLSALRGFPPKVIWFQSGNGPTAQVEALIMGHLLEIKAFLIDPGSGLLVVK